MRKKDFLFYLNRMAEQKKKENDEIESSRKGSATKSKPQGKMKYLGR